MSGPPSGALLAAGSVLLCCAVLTAVPGGEALDRAVSDLAQLGAASAAAGTAGWRATRHTGRVRTAWALLAAACAAWALGQAYWTWSGLVLGGGPPFPSAADAGFLSFPLLAGAALLTVPAGGGRTGRWQRALDAVMTSCAVGLVSWQTSLGSVVAADEAEDALTSALLVAYPLSDVLLLVLTVLTLSRSRHGRAPLVLVGVGLCALSISDSVFVHLAATGTYTGGAMTLGWVAAFLSLALAGLSDLGAVPPADPAVDPAAGPAAPRVETPGVRTAYLPYVPVAVALVLSVVRGMYGSPLGGGQLLTAGTVVSLLLARQYIALHDNTRLALELAAREAELRHQAFHDALTGLANRALFRDRLEHALALHARDLRPVAVVFLDLDDFKAVNDTMGHAAGDELLVRVAERLTGSVRSGDTVARLGGDEFAVLLEDGGSALDAGAKIADALRATFTVRHTALDVHASVGICALAPDDAPLTADELLVRADTAMYAAKRAGRNQIVSWTTGMDLAVLHAHPHG